MAAVANGSKCNSSELLFRADPPHGRVFNFSAGPSCLPVEVLREAQQQLLNCNASGMSVMEMSHRSKEFLHLHREARETLRHLLAVPDDYHLLFMHGGATQQFSCVPLNLLPAMGETADYAITGSWSEKAYKEGLKYANAQTVCNTQTSNYSTIPPVKEWNLHADAAFVHYCSNETIYGVEFKDTPGVEKPLVCDMSSNFCSKPVEVGRHAVIYAGVQKNLGPAAAAVVVVKEQYCKGKELGICPTVCSYSVTAENDSLYNTPPCWSIYMIGLMAKYVKQKGGLSYMKEFSERKAKLLYDRIESSDGYYRSPVDPACRSNMNVPFRVGGGSEILEKMFLSEAEKRKLVTLGGHRSIGGCRASLYNGMTMDGVSTLVEFMTEFKEENPI